MRTGELEQARVNLWRSHRVFPSDRPLIEVARIYLHAIEGTGEPQRRRRFFESASVALDRAAEANPLRAEIPLLRGGLIEATGGAAIDDWREQAVRGYRDALLLDPRQWEARTGLVRRLEADGRQHALADVVANGLRYARYGAAAELPFVGTATRILAERGELDRADALYAELRAHTDPLGVAPGALAALGVGRWQPLLEARWSGHD